MIWSLQNHTFTCGLLLWTMSTITGATIYVIPLYFIRYLQCDKQIIDGVWSLSSSVPPTSFDLASTTSLCMYIVLSEWVRSWGIHTHTGTGTLLHLQFGTLHIHPLGKKVPFQFIDQMIPVKWGCCIHCIKMCLHIRVDWYISSMYFEPVSTLNSEPMMKCWSFQADYSCEQTIKASLHIKVYRIRCQL